jgi:hypothetical protein
MQWYSSPTGSNGCTHVLRTSCKNTYIFRTNCCFVGGQMDYQWCFWKITTLLRWVVLCDKEIKYWLTSFLEWKNKKESITYVITNYHAEFFFVGRSYEVACNVITKINIISSDQFFLYVYIDPKLMIILYNQLKSVFSQTRNQTKLNSFYFLEIVIPKISLLIRYTLVVDQTDKVNSSDPVKTS